MLSKNKLNNVDVDEAVVPTVVVGKLCLVVKVLFEPQQSLRFFLSMKLAIDFFLHLLVGRLTDSLGYLVISA